MRRLAANRRLKIIEIVFDNGHEKTYKYDDRGDRVIKRGPQGETVYVNQFYTQRPGATGTKHVYAGKTRIASKLLRQDVPNSNPHGNTPFEKDIYFYHADHLGSSNHITDLHGKLYEALIYFPFGEGWIEENTNVQRTPYHFSAKELDEETGLYYFGTRYYDPRTSVWQSPDRVLDNYLPKGERANELPGMGGIYNPFNLGVYSYAHLNPVRYNDPDGDIPLDTIVDIGFVIYDTGRVLGAGAAYIAGAVTGDQALKAEALEGLKESGGDLVASGVGLATPYVPAVVTRGARTGGKLLSKSDDARQSLVQANKAKGDAFEAQKLKEIKESGTAKDVATQVTVKTESGTKTRLDIVTRDAQGNIKCVECKSSSTAPLTPKQKAAYPEMEKSGATVVGEGKPGFPGGTKIPPTKVEIVRPPE